MLNKIVYINSGEKTYPLIFNINVMELFQAEFGSLSAWGDVISPSEGEPNIAAIKKSLLFMLNEAIDIENEEKNENMPKIKTANFTLRFYKFN